MTKTTRVESDRFSLSPSAMREVETTRLQAVIDAFPASVMVVDLDCRVALANRAAHATSGIQDIVSAGLKCYEVSHRRTSSCVGTGIECPAQAVVATKAPSSTTHTHFDAEGRKIYVEVTAAPICDASGEVVQIVHSCRDITERQLSRRFLEIGNRHMEMKPLLEEATVELKAFTGCSVVGIRVLDEDGNTFFSSHRCPSEESQEFQKPSSNHRERCVCMGIISSKPKAVSVPLTESGSTYIDGQMEFCATLTDEEINKMSDPCHLCGCEALAQVPIRIGDRTLGHIHVGDRERNMVSACKMRSLERLAVDLAAAIQRVQSQETLRAAHDQLEARIQERTTELTNTNQALKDEITERARLERDILEVSSEEQRRIGQELHDGLGQELTGLGYLAQSLLHKLRSKGSAEADIAAELARSIPLSLAQIRNIVRGLIPLEVGADDLESALQTLASNIEQQTNISCRFVSNGRVRLGSDDIALQIYRIAQESIANAVRHARAREIVVTLASEDNRVRLEVRDDGVGIRLESEKASGYGLRTMKYRACALGGEFEVRRVAGGTRVCFDLSWDSDIRLNAGDVGP